MKGTQQTAAHCQAALARKLAKFVQRPQTLHYVHNTLHTVQCTYTLTTVHNTQHTVHTQYTLYIYKQKVYTKTCALHTTHQGNTICTKLYRVYCQHPDPTQTTQCTLCTQPHLHNLQVVCHSLIYCHISSSVTTGHPYCY